MSTQYKVDDRVAKDMSPEQLAAAKNAIALLNTMIQSGVAQPQSAPAPGAGPEVAAGMKMAAGEVSNMAGTQPNEAQTKGETPKKPADPENPILKDIVSGGTDVPTKGKGESGGEGMDATSSAEGRINDIPPEDEQNVKEVAKALGCSMQKAAQIYKSNRVQKSFDSDRLDRIEKGMEGIIRILVPGLARAEEVTGEDREVQKDLRGKPVGSLDSEKVADMVLKSLEEAARKRGASAVRGFAVPDHEVRKELGSTIMKGLAGMAGGLWGPQWPTR